MINIPYNFSGTVDYQPYSTIVNRIKRFTNYENIGKDSSGLYDMYKVTMGDPTKPAIMITASVHGVEWQTAHYVIGAMEQLRDNTYPNEQLRNRLLDNFHLVFLPVLNPWGLDTLPDIYAQFDNAHYNNSNNVDINRDFDNRSQQETKNVIEQMDKYKPFAHIDCHMFQPEYGLANGRDIIVGIENNSLYWLRDDIIHSMGNYTGRAIQGWDKTTSVGKVRDYTTKLKNPHTPHTIAVLAELERPANVNGAFVQKISNNEIYDYGNAFLYSFFTLAIDYYYSNNLEYGLVNKVVTPTKTIEVVRDIEGVATSVTETYHNTNVTVKSTINRNYYGAVESIDKEKI